MWWIIFSAWIVEFFIIYGVMIVYYCLKKRPVVAIAVAYRSWMFRPLCNLITYPDQQLVLAVKGIMNIMKPDGLPVCPIEIRRMHPDWNEYTEDGGKLLAIHSPGRRHLILVSDEAARFDEVQCFWVVGHEMGHYLDHVTHRKGHRLFPLVQNAGDEEFADAVAWYCLEYALAAREDRQLDWGSFSRVLPGILRLKVKPPYIVPGIC